MDRASPDVVKSIERTLEKKFGNLCYRRHHRGRRYRLCCGGHEQRRPRNRKIHIRRTDAERSEAGRRYTLEDVRIRGHSNSRQYGYTGIYTGGRFKGSCGRYQGFYSRSRRCIYANMSTRMRESVQTDVEYLHNVRMRDVEEAQQRIVSIIRRLEDEGTLVISKGGKEDEIIA